MNQNKTTQTSVSVAGYLENIEDEGRRNDCLAIAGIMKEITGEEPKMWGESIVGFGSYHYKYSSGREGDWFITGFSSRKQNLTLYLFYGFDDHHELTSRLGKYKTGKACLYIKSLAHIDLEVLKEIIYISVQKAKETFTE